ELFADGLHRESLSRRLLESPGNRGIVVLQTELTHEVEDLRKRTTERKRDDSLAAAVQETRGFGKQLRAKLRAPGGVQENGVRKRMSGEARVGRITDQVGEYLW